jgi:hypothetical protein
MKQATLTGDRMRAMQSIDEVILLLAELRLRSQEE